MCHSPQYPNRHIQQARFCRRQWAQLENAVQMHPACCSKVSVRHPGSEADMSRQAQCYALDGIPVNLGRSFACLCPACSTQEASCVNKPDAVVREIHMQRLIGINATHQVVAKNDMDCGQLCPPGLADNESSTNQGLHSETAPHSAGLKLLYKTEPLSLASGSKAP